MSLPIVRCDDAGASSEELPLMPVLRRPVGDARSVTSVHGAAP